VSNEPFHVAFRHRCIILVDEVVNTDYKEQRLHHADAIVTYNITYSSIAVKHFMREIFAQRLRAARELRKMSQGDLAEKTGLQPSAISHFETGTRGPSFDNLKLLADALIVTTDYLLGRTDDPSASGPTADNILHHARKLTDHDFRALQAMAEALARKNR
jgi:transcriptional regulator with XRE-family HTH domain